MKTIDCKALTRQYLQNRQSPVILKIKLESFLTLSERMEELVSYREIKERFNIREETEGAPPIND